MGSGRSEVSEAAGSRALRVIRQPIPGRALQRLFQKRLKLPRRIVQPVIRAAKIASSPAQYRLRRRLAQEVMASLPPERAMPWSDGHRFFAAGELPGSEAVVSRCAEIAAEKRVAAYALNPRKTFLLSILAGSDFLAHPELVRFMVSRPILDVATAYLGSVPLLAGANLLYSPVNESVRSSQLYHIDDEDRSQVKIFINVTATDEDQGPFTFLPAALSDRIRRRLRYDGGRLPEEAVEAAGGRGRALRLLGPPGSGLFVDTSRCLHYGSRANRRDRLVLLIQFFRFHGASESKARFQVSPALPGLDPDPLQRLALGIG